MYDAVFVLVEALTKILRKKPDQFRSYTMRRQGVSTQPTFGNTTLGIGATTGGGLGNGNGGTGTAATAPRPLDCNTSKGWVTPWEHGDRISRYLRKVSTKNSSLINNNIFIRSFVCFQNRQLVLFVYGVVLVLFIRLCLLCLCMCQSQGGNGYWIPVC